MIPAPLSTTLRLLAAAAAVAAACSAHAAPPKGAGVAWVPISTEAEADRVFAQARANGKPVFLYWGAVWCPPCNQVQATLFNRPDFAERAKAFTPVYVDGDKPGAQKVAARFKVTGYPTMVLFRPDGTEVTRLPGEVDPERYLMTLTSGLNAEMPARQLAERALGGQPLTQQQWQVLAYYPWYADQEQVLAKQDLPRQLTRLAAAVPADQPALRDRLALKALAAAADSSAKADPAVLEAGRKLVDRLIADPQAGQVGDVLMMQAETLTRFLAEGPARKELAGRLDAVLARLLQNPSLSRGDQVDGLDARVSLWTLMSEPQPLETARKETVLRELDRIVTASTDRYERQAVVPSAAHVLARAGLLDASDALLKAELPRAVAPYYHMVGLADNAKKRKDAAGALAWYEQAWKKSEGPATRIQWGAGYLRNVIDLTPADVRRVDATATALIAELQPKGETFFERNQRSLRRAAQKLTAWSGDDKARAQVVAQLKAKLDKTCRKLPAKDPGRANCEKVFEPGEA